MTRGETEGGLCWAVLAPLEPRVIQRLAMKAVHEQVAMILDDDPFEVIAGTREYAALVEWEPGSEGTDIPLAEALARATGKPVYSLWLAPERLAIAVYQGGKRVGSRAELPYELAASLGVALPRPTPPAEERSLAVIAGAGSAEVTRALGEDAAEPWLHVEEGPRGVLLHADGGDIGMRGWDVAEALPDATVYLVLRWPARGEYAVHLLRGARTLGVFCHPPRPHRSAPALADVQGATDLSAIAAALGVPSSLLVG